MQNLMLIRKFEKKEKVEIMSLSIISSLFLIACSFVIVTTDAVYSTLGEASYSIPMLVAVIYLALMIYEFQCFSKSYYFFYDSKIVLHNKIGEFDLIYSKLNHFYEKDGIIYIVDKDGETYDIRVDQEEVEYAIREISTKLKMVDLESISN